MPFDLSTASPVAPTAGGFDLSTAKVAPPQVSAADAAMADPANGMSPLARFVAGYGKAGHDLVQGVGQRIGEGIDALAPAQKGLSSLITGQAPQTLSSKLGLPQQSDVDESHRLDTALMNTTAGKVGHLAGSVIDALPVAFVPGVNTVAGAAATGAVLGGAAPTATGESAGRNALLGAALGGGSVVGGRLVGAGINKLLQPSAASVAAAANPLRAAAVQSARDAGYVLPPTEISSSPINTVLEGISGKVKTSQAASMKNQPLTNSMAAQALGLPPESPLTPDVLDEIRKAAGNAYQAVTKLPVMDAAGADLPASVNVVKSTDPLTLAPKAAVDPGELVRAWKQANNDANSYFTAYGRDANPETLAKAKSSAGDAKQIDKFLDDTLSQSGQGDLLDQLKAARVQIAKTYSVEKALNPTTGDVSAGVLANQLAKGKPLSGGLQTIAQAGQAFPKAMQSLPQNYNAFSPLDFATAAISGNPAHLAIPLVRPGVRAAILSEAGQRFATPNTTPNALLRLLNTSNSSGALLAQGRRSASIAANQNNNP